MEQAGGTPAGWRQVCCPASDSVSCSLESPDEVTNLGEEEKQKTLEIYGRELRSVTSRGHRGKRLR